MGQIQNRTIFIPLMFISRVSGWLLITQGKRRHMKQKMTGRTPNTHTHTHTPKLVDARDVMNYFRGVKYRRIE